jgi:hypothetical protein
MFEQEDLAPAFRQAVGAGHAGEPAADYDDVIVVADSIEPVVSHEAIH